MSQHELDGQLRRLHGFKKSTESVGGALGPELVSFFKQSVTKRQGKFARISESWTALVPALLADHCAFEGFSRGTLTVLVDSSSHLYDLKQLLLAGLQQQLLLACGAAGLRKIVLKPGRWYEGDGSDVRIRFER